MSTGRPLAAKLFLEGIEVPFIGATLTHTVNQAAIAYIDLVPHKLINDIKPRTLVSLYVKDFNAPDKGFPYVLAFEGEVFGFSFAKTPSSRSFSISCIDKSSYWDNVLTYFFNAQQSLGKGAAAISAQAYDDRDARQQGIKVNATTHPTSSYFIQVMKAAFAKNPSADMLDGLVAVYKNITTLNDFYNLAEDRLRIIDRIRLKSSGQLPNLLKQQEALSWFHGIIGRQSGFQTLRMVIQDLMSIIFHDFVSIPFPAAVDAPGVKKSLTEGAKVPNTIGEFLFKPNLYMLPPPACNVFFPDEYSSFNFNRNFFQEPTRLIYKPEMPTWGGEQAPVALPHVYQPESFAHFMQKGSKTAYPSELKGTEATQIGTSDNPGKFGDADTSEFKVSNNGSKREQQFLTNEEKLKGILMAQESMVPASSQFRQSLSELGRKEFSKLVAKYLFFKKRFQGREVQITSHLKMSVVPGFPVLILDDSDAGQTVVAYCSSVTHRIYATQGGYTNVSLAYARNVGEQDSTSNKAGEPLIPPWFSTAVFGEKGTPPASKDKKIDKKVQAAGKQTLVPKKLSEFYASLLGPDGSKTINDLMNESTLLGAAEKLVTIYKQARKDGSAATHTLIDSTTRRKYVGIKEAFNFIGAKSTATNYNTPFLEFVGDRIAGLAGKRDDEQIKLRREVIIKYRDELKNKRGFRG